MNIPAAALLSSSRRLALVALILAFTLAAAPGMGEAQVPAKKALTVEDYPLWRQISSPAISGDGKWAAYILQQSNTIPAESKPVLHLVNLETDVEVTVADASDPAFSPDSKWITYQVDPGAAQRARAARNASSSSSSAPQGTPAPTPAGQAGGQTGQGGQAGRGGAAAPIPPRRLELRALATGAVRSWQEVGTSVFSPTSTHLVLRRRGEESASPSGQRGGGPPGGGGPRGGGGSSTLARGLETIILDLRTGGFQPLGHLNDFAFNRTGELLAFTADVTAKDGNGLFIFDTRNGRVTPLDNDAKLYSRLVWNEDGTAVAVLKGSEVEKMRERSNVLLVIPDIPASLKDGAALPVPVVFEPEKADGFPKGWVVSDRGALAWSEDNKRVFFGMKEQVPTPDTTRKSTDEAPDVDVWNTGDERVQSLQMVRAEQERNFTFRQAFDVSAKKFVKLADETMRDLDVAPDGRWAVGTDDRAYIRNEKILPTADLYRVDTATGGRALIVKAQLTGRHVFGLNPHGTHFLYWRDGRIMAYDLASGTAKPLAGGAVSFVDREYDHPGTKPSYGLAGHTKDGRAVIAQHRHDLWLVPLDGSAPKNLTRGLGPAKDIRFRLLRPAPPDPTVRRSEGPRGTVDLAKPVLLSAYGEWTKKSGYYELANGEMKELVFEDASHGPPTRAMKADRFLFTRQTFAEFPDLRVSGPGFREAKKISDANPQQKDFLWGRRLLFDYKNKDGVRLQGILAIPDDYKPGEKRPM
ncbi:MAG: hypothetical protein FJY80_10545, partial [Candidatus Aminicenantes bacterium]|nr:hypothetical protein [Candidatus Aminicenantes bacterium]